MTDIAISSTTRNRSIARSAKNATSTTSHGNERSSLFPRMAINKHHEEAEVQKAKRELERDRSTPDQLTAAAAGTLGENGWNFRSRSEFETTSVLEMAMIAAAMIGLSSPRAASGIPSVL